MMSPSGTSAMLCLPSVEAGNLPGSPGRGSSCLIPCRNIIQALEHRLPGSPIQLLLPVRSAQVADHQYRVAALCQPRRYPHNIDIPRSVARVLTEERKGVIQPDDRDVAALVDGECRRIEHVEVGLSLVGGRRR